MKKRKGVHVRLHSDQDFKGATVYIKLRGRYNFDAPSSICGFWADRLGLTKKGRYKIVAIPVK